MSATSGPAPAGGPGSTATSGSTSTSGNAGVTPTTSHAHLVERPIADNSWPATLKLSITECNWVEWSRRLTLLADRLYVSDYLDGTLPCPDGSADPAGHNMLLRSVTIPFKNLIQYLSFRSITSAEPPSCPSSPSRIISSSFPPELIPQSKEILHRSSIPVLALQSRPQTLIQTPTTKSCHTNDITVLDPDPDPDL
jgi:hypothetical protein